MYVYFQLLKMTFDKNADPVQKDKQQALLSKVSNRCNQILVSLSVFRK